MTAGAIFHPIGLVAERVRRPVGVSLLLLVGFNTGTNAQLVPEPQGKPAATSSVPATRGQPPSIDLLSMFLWGLGLTAFGAGIQQLTPRQVATQIGVVVPRSAAREAANP